jgi:hypothetical protein
VHVAVIHAEHQDQHHLGDEEQAEEEGEAAQRLLAPLLEREIEHLIDRLAQQIERRQHDDGREDRVEPERGVDDVGDVGADDDEGGVRDVDHVEHAERDGDADRHRGVETAEQQPGDDGVEQQVRGHGPGHRACARRGVMSSKVVADTTILPVAAALAARLRYALRQPLCSKAAGLAILHRLRSNWRKRCQHKVLRQDRG